MAAVVENVSYTCVLFNQKNKNKSIEKRPSFTFSLKKLFLNKVKIQFNGQTLNEKILSLDEKLKFPSIEGKEGISVRSQFLTVPVGSFQTDSKMLTWTKTKIFFAISILVIVFSSFIKNCKYRPHHQVSKRSHIFGIRDSLCSVSSN